MSRRLIALLALAAISASPMIWFSVDSNAGQTLLKLTQAAKTHAAIAKPATAATPATLPH